MKRYLIILLSITLLLVLAALVPMWTGDARYQCVMPFIPLYFALVTGVEHWAVVESMNKSPRTFVKNFLGITVGVLFVHLVVMSLWMFTHAREAKWFAVAFCVCYVVYLVLETAALALLVRNAGKKNKEIEKKSAE